MSEEEISQVTDQPLEEVKRSLDQSRRKLFLLRETRIKPARDEKILTAWNGLMIAALAEAAVVLGRTDYASAAEKAGEFVLQNLKRGGLLLRTSKDGDARLNGYLEDYAFFIDALIMLFETTGNVRWLNEAVTLTDTMIREFWDESEGGFYFTGVSHEELIVRSKDFYDNATPSGNSVATQVLLKLAAILDRDDYRRMATAVLRLLKQPLNTHPSAFGRLLQAQDFLLSNTKEVVVVGNRNTSDFDALVNEIWAGYLPNKIVVLSSPDSLESANLPILNGRTTIGGAATAYVCENYACQTPTTDPAVLRNQMAAL